MSYDTEVLADDPKGYWKLAETSGTTLVDSSTYGYTGAYVGTANTHYTLGQGSLILTAPSATSVLFSRTGSATDTWGTTGGIGRAYIPYTADFNVSGVSFSVECWFKAAAITTDYGNVDALLTRHLDSYLVTRRQRYNASMQWNLRPTSLGEIQAGLYGPGIGGANNHQQYMSISAAGKANAPDYYLSDGTVEPFSTEYLQGPFDGSPHHAVMTYDASTRTLRCYLDGVSTQYVVLTSGFSIPSNVADPIIIASNNSLDGNYGFIGNISHVAFYRTALSQSRVLAHYYAGSGNHTTLHFDYVTYAPKGETFTEGMNITPVQIIYDAPRIIETVNIAHTEVVYLPVLVTISDSFVASSSANPAATMSGVIAENIATAATQVGTRVVPTTVTESLDMNDDAMFSQKLVVAIREGLSIRVGFDTGDTSYVGWTMNANTSAISMYDNFSFNSFAKIEGKHYGCRADGVYELVGELDDVNDINVSVLFPNTDFGSSNLKRIAKAYFGIRSNGGVQLRTITNDGEENTYLLDRYNGVIKEARMEFGRGLRSRYWQLELKNVAGSDFALDEIELMLNTTTRRI